MGLGFEFDDAKAEWMRWYAELSASSDDTMLGSGLSRDFYLYNWWGLPLISMTMANSWLSGNAPFLPTHASTRMRILTVIACSACPA